jgi:hypothetical protein
VANRPCRTDVRLADTAVATAKVVALTQGGTFGSGPRCLGLVLYPVKSFFPVKVSERTRRFSGIEAPSSPAVGSRVVGPGLRCGAGPESGVAKFTLLLFAPAFADMY